MRERPIGITLVAAFLFAATAIAVFIGLDLLFPVRSLDWIWRLNQRAAGTFRPNARLGGIFLLLVAVVVSSGGARIVAGKTLGMVACHRHLYRKRSWRSDQLYHHSRCAEECIGRGDRGGVLADADAATGEGFLGG